MGDLVERAFVRRAIEDEDGQTLLEYGLLMVLVAVVVVSALAMFGPTVANLYNNANSSIAF